MILLWQFLLAMTGHAVCTLYCMPSSAYPLTPVLDLRTPFPPYQLTLGISRI